MNDTGPPALTATLEASQVFLWLAVLVLGIVWILGRTVLQDTGTAATAKTITISPQLQKLVGYLFLALFAIGFALFFFEKTVWDWLPRYTLEIVNGIWVTLSLLVLSIVIGFAIAVPVGLVQVTGPLPLRMLAKGYCTLIRGTPLLIQLWILYYGLGSLFPSIPWIRSSFIWPLLREGYFYGLLALTLSVIGYEGEVMRGAFLGVPKGELEAARAFGMSPFTVVRRIWFPRAVRLVLPTLGGEVIGQLKSTPVVSTVTVFDLYGVSSKIRQETYLVYEPLLLVAVIYFALVYILTRMLAAVERQVPQKR